MERYRVKMIQEQTANTAKRGFSWLTSIFTTQRRIGVTITFLVPATAASIVAVFFMKPERQPIMLRIIFLVVVCCLPALLYYLFIATKKYSLLNEFILNLNRLGLLYPERLPSKELICAGLQGETPDERKNRIYTYVQKFEAVYGAIPTALGALVLKPTDPGQRTLDWRINKLDSWSFANIFSIDTTVPVLLATVLISLGWLVTLPPLRGQLVLGRQGSIVGLQPQESSSVGLQQESSSRADAGWLKVFIPVKSPVHFAFMSAYFFSLQLLFRRYVRRDLRASAYVAVSLRIILAVIGIWIVVEAFAVLSPWDVLGNQQPTGGQNQQTLDSVLLLMGFVIGVFPRMAWQIVQATLKRAGSLILPSLQTQLPLSDLDGLTVWHEARFEEEDIENIPNMATADLVDLMINTRFAPDRIIDWVDQAILYTHLGPEQPGEGEPSRRGILRAHGIRTATALVEAYNRSEEHNDCPALENILPGDGRKLMRSLVDTIGTNPNLRMIQAWRGLLPHYHRPASAHTSSPANST